MKRRRLWSLWPLLCSLLIGAVFADECQLSTHSLQCLSVADFSDFIAANNSTAMASIQRLAIRCDRPETDLPNTPMSVEMPRLVDLQIRGCGADAVRRFRRLQYRRLEKLDLTSNQMKTFEWTLARAFNAKRVDLTANPIECSCANQWLFDVSQKTANASVIDVLQLPAKVILNYAAIRQCRSLDCARERTQLKPPLINTELSAAAQLTCEFERPLPPKSGFEPDDVFGWLMDNEEARAERSERWKVVLVDGKTVRLEIWNLTSSDLGLIICRCLHCVVPSYAMSELRFETPISSTLYVGPEKDVQLTVHGYPLQNLTMTVTRLNDNTSETQLLLEEESVKNEFFNGTFTTRFEADHSYAFLKYFSLFIKECAQCPRHLNTKASEYEIQVCTQRNDDCTITQTAMGHRVDLDYDPNLRSFNSRSNSDPMFSNTFILVLFLIVMPMVVVALLLLRSYRKSKAASKIVTAVGWHKKSRFRRTSRTTTRTEETSLTRLDDSSMAGTMSNYSLQHVPLIEKAELTLEDKIGQGAFGEVFTGEWRPKSSSPVRVAIKTLHNIQVDAQMDKEAALLSALDHENVVRMFGVCRAGDQGLYLVLELMCMGDLKTYVKARQPQCDNYSQFPPALLPTELINIARQVCTGLCYISSQQIVHRDLAARNCLVTGESDMRVCTPAFRPAVTVKISDFGMSRRLYSETEYYKMGDKKTALPVRWLPPECLESGKFTHQSDMWSFGVTMYEIFSYGAMPYGDLSNNEALMAVINGVRPTVPAKCPEPIAELMRDCWRLDPSERPVADDALIRLKQIQ